MSAQLWLAGNSHDIELVGLADRLGVAVTGATVTAHLRRGGEDVVGETWPVTLDHVAGGTYRAELAATLEVAPGDRLDATVVAVAPGGARYEAVLPVLVLQRLGLTATR